jgi:hypothetical protein
LVQRLLALAQVIHAERGGGDCIAFFGIMGVCVSSGLLTTCKC